MSVVTLAHVNTSTTPATSCVVQQPGFAWNHGDIQPEIGRTFIGIVGPGVRNLGVTRPHDFFTDHVDVRPTMLFLSGVVDDYESDGRVILEVLDPAILPSSLHANSETLLKLGQIYKQIDAPFGQLAKSALTVSTYAIESDTSGDVTYKKLENQIASWTKQRDDLTARIQSILGGAEFHREGVDQDQVQQLIAQGQALLDQATDCASNPGKCALSNSSGEQDQ